MIHHNDKGITVRDFLPGGILIIHNRELTAAPKGIRKALLANFHVTWSPEKNNVHRCVPKVDTMDQALALFDPGSRVADLKPGEPCSHPGCLNHKTHPCEGCGRID